MKKLRIGIIGLGGRGQGLLKGSLLQIDRAEVTAVCDEYQDRMEYGAKLVEEKSGKRPLMFSDYRKMLDKKIADAVIISAYWENHTEIAVAAMEAGMPSGLEVGGAYSIDGCWQLVRTYERTKTPIMFMENCCYNKEELFSLSLARAGMLGEISHCSGMYAHDLRSEIAYGYQNRHYRLRNYLMRNCDNYPTHDLGPIAKLLDINRGNRMLTLVSMASKSAGLSEYVKDKEDLSGLHGKQFAQGDVTTTIIKCAGGETITLCLDTTLPRLYDRALTIHGTKGYYSQSLKMFLEDGTFDEEKDKQINFVSNQEKYFDKYLPQVWKDITPEQIAAGHGGMDFIMMNSFIDALESGGEMPLDIYDAAAWMSISCLTEQSIAGGGAIVHIPDFTDGKWIMRQRKDAIKFKAAD